MCVYVIRLATPWHRTGSFPHRRISLASECARLTREIYIYIYVGPCVCTCVRLNALNHRLHLTRAVCVVPIRSDRTDLARAQMCSHGCACICVCVCLISKIAGLSVNINAEYKAFVGGLLTFRLVGFGAVLLVELLHFELAFRGCNADRVPVLPCFSVIEHAALLIDTLTAMNPW